MEQESVDGGGAGNRHRRAQARRGRADRSARQLAAPYRASLLALRGGRRGRLPARAGDPAHESAQPADERTGPLDPHGDQARGAGGSPQARADARRRPAVGRGPRPRGLGRADPGERRRPGRAGRARRADRPQPRGAADPEAGRAAGADPARGGLLLRRDRRDHRVQPDKSQPLPGRGTGALPQLFARSEDGGRCAELRPLLSAFCDGEAGDEGCRRRARAPAGLRRLPGDDARLPGDRRAPRPRWRRSCRAALAARAGPRSRRGGPIAAPVRRRRQRRLGDLAGGRGGRDPRRGDGGAGEAADDLRRHRRRRGRLRRRRGDPGAPARRTTRRRSRRSSTSRRPPSRLPRPSRSNRRHRPRSPSPSPRRSRHRPGSGRTRAGPRTAAPTASASPETSAGAVEYTPPASTGAAPRAADESSPPSSGSAAGEFGP